MLLLDERVARHLACPRDFKPLELSSGRLTCPENHSYPIVHGVPVFLLKETIPTQQRFWQWLDRPETFSPRYASLTPGDPVDPFVRQALPSASGTLYRPAAKRMRRYPIPELPLPPGEGKIFLDLGCNWGRWCLSAASKGYTAIGIDPNPEAVLAARRVSQQLNIPASFLVADARHLPFASGCLETVFSYSVLQHFERDGVRQAVGEAARVLKNSGTVFIEMPNAFGLYNLVHQAKRGFRRERDFEVRYWTPGALRKLFGQVGPPLLIADGYFSLNPQMRDLDLLPFAYRCVIRISEWLRKQSLKWPWLINVADSLYVKASRPETIP